LAIATSCYESNDLGMELLPSTDLIEVKNLVEKNSISAYTYTDGPIRTDEPSKSLLGSFYDPVFGLSTINFATQFRLQDFPEYGTNPVADSVKLFLYYRLMYGDTITPQRFRVYELETPLNIDQNYTQDVNLEAMAYDRLLGELIYKPVVRIDSASRDTFYQLITIPLDISLGEKLVNADSSQMINNDRFIGFFKGLLIEAEEQTVPGGSILTLEAASSNIFQGSALVVYYNNEENRNKEIPDTMLNPYVITQFSARVNSIEHDYSGTPFEANLNVETGEDSLIYVQATGGLKAKINIEGLSELLDSLNVGNVVTAINKAELIFQVDTIATDMERFPPPSQLLFTFIDDNGNEQLPNDYWFSPAFYGGQLRTSDYTYRFNITQHLQRILDGKINNNGFFLSVARKNSEASRVIIKGSESQTGIKMVVTYSKFTR
jgi:hypothetical protein